jgi:hypothetical protein
VSVVQNFLLTVAITSAIVSRSNCTRMYMHRLMVHAILSVSSLVPWVSRLGGAP